MHVGAREHLRRVNTPLCVILSLLPKGSWYLEYLLKQSITSANTRVTSMLYSHRHQSRRKRTEEFQEGMSSRKLLKIHDIWFKETVINGELYARPWYFRCFLSRTKVKTERRNFLDETSRHTYSSLKSLQVKFFLKLAKFFFARREKVV